jgi:hypothetical protein
MQVTDCSEPLTRGRWNGGKQNEANEEKRRVPELRCGVRGIVGYGQYHYQYASGREGDFLLTGFSPRKQALTVYIIPGFKPFDSMMKKLGKYKTGKSCLYIKRLSDVHEAVLEQLISASVKHMRKNYETK